MKAIYRPDNPDVVAYWEVQLIDDSDENDWAFVSNIKPEGMKSYFFVFFFPIHLLIY